MRSRSTFAVAALSLAFVTCRKPPPLPQHAQAQTPAPASSPSTREVKTVQAPAAAAASEPSPTAAPPPDHSHEHRDLAARFGSRRPLSTLRGEASYYGRAFAGRKTASGEIFDPARFTAAHRTLPFGSVLRVTRVGTKAVVYVRVNDRGPFGKKRRIIDLSEAAAGELDMLRDGICDVRVEVLERGKR